jgi:hypothetical protein
VPYTRFVKTKKGVSVFKKTKSGKEVKAFTAHTKSVKEAKRRAALRHKHSKS